MRIIEMNGYIDEDVWYGDEITPEMLHDRLYAEGEDLSMPVRIILNSYGGSCNAAVRMYDDVRAYPGDVHIIVSGTAASAATVLAMAADRLEMTPGSMWMIHDPSIFACGNEHDLLQAIDQLKACKESILNVYDRRCHRTRDDVSGMMTATTWMDSHKAVADGFVDGIVDMGSGIINAGTDRTVVLQDAEAKVKMWIDRSRSRMIHRAETNEEPKIKETHAPKQEVQAAEASHPGVPAEQLHKRLDLIRPRH